MTTEAVVSTSNCETASDVRRMFYKKPIKKDNLKLDIDYNTSQERRRKILLEYQKRYIIYHMICGIIRLEIHKYTKYNI